MSLALKIFRLRNQITSFIAPSWTAKKSMELFIRPRRHQPKEWELKAEKLGERIRINKDISAIKWVTDRSNINTKLVLLAHGWESRGTQMYGFVPKLLEQGYNVIAIDMPAHGQSFGNKANPLKFAETIMLAEKKFGQFEAIIGHSMGAGAIGISVYLGLNSSKLVLISGPGSIESVLKRFCKFIGISTKSTDLFLTYIGEYVGMSPIELDEKLLQMRSSIPTLVIHDKNDLEVPFKDTNSTLTIFTNSELLITNGLGHRKILKSDIVLSKVNDFLNGIELGVMT